MSEIISMFDGMTTDSDLSRGINIGAMPDEGYFEQPVSDLLQENQYFSCTCPTGVWYFYHNTIGCYVPHSEKYSAVLFRFFLEKEELEEGVYVDSLYIRDVYFTQPCCFISGESVTRSLWLNEWDFYAAVPHPKYSIIIGSQISHKRADCTHKLSDNISNAIIIKSTVVFDDDQETLNISNIKIERSRVTITGVAEGLDITDCIYLVVSNFAINVKIFPGVNNCEIRLQDDTYDHTKQTFVFAEDCIVSADDVASALRSSKRIVLVDPNRPNVKLSFNSISSNRYISYTTCKTLEFSRAVGSEVDLISDLQLGKFYNFDLGWYQYKECLYCDCYFDKNSMCYYHRFICYQPDSSREMEKCPFYITLVEESVDGTIVLRLCFENDYRYPVIPIKETPYSDYSSVDQKLMRLLSNAVSYEDAHKYRTVDIYNSYSDEVEEGFMPAGNLTDSGQTKGYTFVKFDNPHEVNKLSNCIVRVVSLDVYVVSQNSYVRSIGTDDILRNKVCEKLPSSPNNNTIYFIKE